MKVLLIGANGQLGRALQGTVPADTEVIALPRDQCDLSSLAQIDYWLKTVRPDLIFNAAAYTAVDAAENDAAAAHLVNATSVGLLAEAARRQGARLVHVSTDFVFDGRSSEPYGPDDKPNPLCVYGHSKLAGELLVMRSLTDALIVRTAWVYAEQGRNFVLTMLKLMAERDTLRVVADQVGTPTYAGNLANALWTLARQSASGIYHFTDAGVASWYDFAIAIQEEGLATGMLRRAATVLPISTSEFPTNAKRPRFSVLDKSKTWQALGAYGPHWRRSLRQMLEGMRNG